MKIRHVGKSYFQMSRLKLVVTGHGSVDQNVMQITNIKNINNSFLCDVIKAWFELKNIYDEKVL